MRIELDPARREGGNRNPLRFLVRFAVENCKNCIHLNSHTHKTRTNSEESLRQYSRMTPSLEILQSHRVGRSERMESAAVGVVKALWRFGRPLAAPLLCAEAVPSPVVRDAGPARDLPPAPQLPHQDEQDLVVSAGGGVGCEGGGWVGVGRGRRGTAAPG